MPRKRLKLPPKPSLARIQAMLARRRWDYVPPEPPPAPPAAPTKPAELPESAGDVHRRAIGLPPAGGRTGDTAKPDKRWQSSSPDSPIPGTARPEHYLDAQNRILYEIGFQGPGFQNLPTEQQKRAEANKIANRERILKLFHETPYSGELLASGKIWYDCKELTLEQWERERFRTAS